MLQIPQRKSWFYGRLPGANTTPRRFLHYKDSTFRISSLTGIVSIRQIQYFSHLKLHMSRFHSTKDSLPLDKYRTFRFSSLTGFASIREIQYFSHLKPHRNRFHSTNTVLFAFQAYRNRFDSSNTVSFAGETSQELLSLDRCSTFRILRLTGLASTRRIQCISHFKYFPSQFNR